MIQYCPNKVDCDGSDSPIANLSSETPEAAYWRAIGFCCDGTMKTYLSRVSYIDAQFGLQRTLFDECAGCPADPPLLYAASASCPDGSGTVTAYSAESQAHAQMLADLMSVDVECPAVTPPLPPTITRFCNAAQSCTVYCPDGSPFTYIVAPCMVYGRTQAEADAIAYAYACRFAAEMKICLSALDKCYCLGIDQSLRVHVTPTKRVYFSLYSGTLPPGVTFVPGWSDVGETFLTWQPTTAGNYTFALMATDADGNYMVKSYTVWIIDVDDQELDEYEVGEEYSYQLTATGGSGNYTWEITSGELPEGLTMSETGLISGTPTESAGDVDIEFAVTDTECDA